MPEIFLNPKNQIDVIFRWARHLVSPLDCAVETGQGGNFCKSLIEHRKLYHFFTIFHFGRSYPLL